ncbi:hypothetical protein [Arthrobacter ulcerisalmonis]|uniref:hypothetical protein n=1 Tax=Arthrobacter ulcerisalmonis TaxID=2483813 RepID=UPI003645B590
MTEIQQRVIDTGGGALHGFNRGGSFGGKLPVAFACFASWFMLLPNARIMFRIAVSSSRTSTSRTN